MRLDGLGDRMKSQYEDRARLMLPRRTYTILRLDGRAFHTFTRNLGRYDGRIVDGMNGAARAVCMESQGPAFAYLQSDEASILLTDFARESTQAWFDGNLQKIVSVAASIATDAFSMWSGFLGAKFDCRAFTIPDPIEVENYFIWRQKDCERNSLSSFCREHFSHSQLLCADRERQHDMLHDKGLNWNDLSIEEKRGRVIRPLQGQWETDNVIPVFTQNREYLRGLIPKPGYDTFLDTAIKEGKL